MNTYRLQIWLWGSISPTGAAKERRQSLRSVEYFSNRPSVRTAAGKSSASESVCTESRLSPTRISAPPSRMSSSVVVSSCEREKYFSTRPASFPFPVISSVVSRSRRTSPESRMMRSNCSTASRKRRTPSLSRTSLGRICPLQRTEKLLCCRMRPFVVRVMNRYEKWFRKGRSLKWSSKLRSRNPSSSLSVRAL